MNNHAESDRDAFLDSYVGKQLSVKIIECVPEEGRVVYSERAARAESGCRNRLFTALTAGQRVSGEVTNITDFGVFVDLGGVEGLIHISELSWGRVEHPSHVARLGEKLDVQVLDISPERCRVALSLKRLHNNPWELVGQHYAVGDIVSATLTTVVSYGVFARLEEGLEGLVHVSEIKLPAGKMVKEVFTAGQKVHVRILQMDASHHRLGLSMILE
jgi:small subunit ribosomal protein S1